MNLSCPLMKNVALQPTTSKVLANRSLSRLLKIELASHPWTNRTLEAANSKRARKFISYLSLVS
jgi:hypothetical protein